MRLSPWRPTAAGALLAAVVVLGWVSAVRAADNPGDEEPSTKQQPSRHRHHHRAGNQGLGVGLGELAQFLQQLEQAVEDEQTEDGTASGSRGSTKQAGNAGQSGSTSSSGSTQPSAQTASNSGSSSKTRHHHHRRHHHHHRHHGQGLREGLAELSRLLKQASQSHAASASTTTRGGKEHLTQALSRLGRQVGKEIARRAEHAHRETAKHRREDHRQQARQTRSSASTGKGTVATKATNPTKRTLAAGHKGGSHTSHAQAASRPMTGRFLFRAGGHLTYHRGRPMGHAAHAGGGHKR